MKFVTLNLFFFIAFVLSCSSNSYTTKKKDLELRDVSFDAVEKKITFSNMPNSIELLFNDWFENNVKLSGYEGIVKIDITNYLENIKNIQDGKLVELSLDFKVHIQNNKVQNKYISGSANSYGSIQGDFSLNDLDIIIYNSQLELVKKFSDNF